MERTASLGDQQPKSDANSLAAVVYGMVQVRKKTTLGSSFSVPSKDRHSSNPHSLDGGHASASASPSLGGRSLRAPSHSPGKLSVTFSLRRKTRKNPVEGGSRLQRIGSASENNSNRVKNVLLGRVEGPKSEGCASSNEVSQETGVSLGEVSPPSPSHLQIFKDSKSQPTCHSSPDVRRVSSSSKSSYEEVEAKSSERGDVTETSPSPTSSPFQTKKDAGEQVVAGKTSIV